MVSQGHKTVSVLMSVYNCERYLHQAIASILSQTLTDFELIIIDDASTDKTAQILANYDDPRIVLLKNDVNLGQAESLNRGLKIARGIYIARQDADDISLPARLQKQKAYLDMHPEVGVLGTRYRYMDGDDRLGTTLDMFCDHYMIGWALLFGPFFAHTSVMMRRCVVVAAGGYQGGPGQDRDLWIRAKAITHFANLPELLVYYRHHDSMVSRTLRYAQHQRLAELTRQLCSDLLGWDIGLQCAEALNTLIRDERQATGKNATEVARLLRLLCSAYVRREGLTCQQAEDVRRDALMRMDYLLSTHCDKFPWIAKPILWEIIKLGSLGGRERQALRVFSGLRHK